MYYHHDRVLLMVWLEIRQVRSSEQISYIKTFFWSHECIYHVQ